jgi:hypothetical protein
MHVGGMEGCIVRSCKGASWLLSTRRAYPVGNTFDSLLYCSLRVKEQGSAAPLGHGPPKALLEALHVGIKLRSLLYEALKDAAAAGVRSGDSGLPLRKRHR